MTTKVKRHVTHEQVLALLQTHGPCSAYELADRVRARYPHVPAKRAYPTVTACLRFLAGWKVRRAGFEDQHPNGGKKRARWEAV